MKVFVIETGDYDERGVIGVAISVEAAFASIKSKYASNVVRWEEPEEYDDFWVAVAHLADDARHFRITAYDLIGFPDRVSCDDMHPQQDVYHPDGHERALS